MGLKRREFLQQASWTLAALGISELTLSLSCDRYAQALAQPTPRKLALLVGINQYPAGSGLGGCVTDVQLQRELLIHRFGFNHQDIITLTDRDATRQKIEEAFVAHLVEQAKAGDVVIFHFSGYGRQIGAIAKETDVDPAQPGTATGKPKLQNSLVPVDGGLPSEEATVINDVLVETLSLLLRSLPTENAIAILDTCYLYPGHSLQGNLRIRSQPSPSVEQVSPAELAFLETLSPSSAFNVAFRKGSGPQSGAFKGAILTAAGTSQLAAENQWKGFSSGLFTYALTQTLWAATPATTLNISLQRTACSVERLAGQIQQPQGQLLPNRDQSLRAYKLLSAPNPTGDGALLSVEEDGKTAKLWLGGLKPNVLESYGVNSIFTVVPAIEAPENAIAPQLQIRSREGLSAKAQLLNPSDSAAIAPVPNLATNQLVQEAVRVLPRQIGLTVALDTGLQRIERVDVTSAFASIPQVSLVVAGEQPADYLFGRVREAMLAQMPNLSLPALPQSSYALFSLGRDLIFNTVGEGGEAAKSAALRLVPELKTLHAAKLLRLTVNESSSRLGVKVLLEMVAPEPKLLIQRATLRAPWSLPPSKPVDASAATGKILTLPVGSQIRYQVQNYSDRPLYFCLFGLESNGGGIALYPGLSHRNPEASDNSAMMLQEFVVNAGETTTIPSESASFVWATRGPAGLTETMLICSRAPFTRTLAALDTTKHPRTDGQILSSLSNPLSVAQAVLQDLHQASTPVAQLPGATTDDWVLDVNAWATFNFIYRVV